MSSHGLLNLDSDDEGVTSKGKRVASSPKSKKSNNRVLKNSSVTGSLRYPQSTKHGGSSSNLWFGGNTQKLPIGFRVQQEMRQQIPGVKYVSGSTALPAFVNQGIYNETTSNIMT